MKVKKQVYNIKKKKKNTNQKQQQEQKKPKKPNKTPQKIETNQKPNTKLTNTFGLLQIFQIYCYFSAFSFHWVTVAKATIPLLYIIWNAQL